jgi:hypothetical protein
MSVNIYASNDGLPKTRLSIVAYLDVLGFKTAPSAWTQL